MFDIPPHEFYPQSITNEKRQVVTDISYCKHCGGSRTNNLHPERFLSLSRATGRFKINGTQT